MSPRLIVNPPYARGPARAAAATFPYSHPTLAEVDEAHRLNRINSAIGHMWRRHG